MAHRLNLATSQAADAVPLVKEFLSTLTNLFYYFKHSTVRIETLKAIQKALQNEEIRMKEVHEIRWSAFYNCLDAVYRSIVPLMVYFKGVKAKAKQGSSTSTNKGKGTTRSSDKRADAAEQPGKSAQSASSSTNKRSKPVTCDKEKSNERDKSEDMPGKEKSKREQELKDRINSYQFISILHYLMDIIPALASLSLVFQKDDIDICAFSVSIKNVLQYIDKAKSGKGIYQNECRDKTQIRNGKCTFREHEVTYNDGDHSEKTESRKRFCEELRDRIQARFPVEATNIINAFDIIGLRNIRSLAPDDLRTFGNEKLDVLLDQFGEDKESANGIRDALIDPTETKIEWRNLKEIVETQHYSGNSTADLWNIISAHHGASFPNLLRLSEIGLLMPLQTAAVERGFSVQNIIHSKQRNRLNPDSVSRLMTVSIEGDNIEKFDWMKAVSHWKGQKQRVILK